MRSKEAAAVELRRAGRDLVAAIGQLAHATTSEARIEQLARIERLRAVRDAASQDYRAVCAAYGVPA